MATDILIVDDEDDIRELVSGILSDEGHGTRLARNSDEALAAIEARRPHLVLLDIWLQGSRLDGLQLLEILKQQHANVPVVMISGHGNIETAVTAIKLGAYDFIEKPFKADRLILVAERALETSRLRREVSDLRARSGAANRLVGSSAVVTNLRRIIERVGPANSRVLISGPAGSGKELAARLIHAHSARADGPFVVVNAPTITPEGMESELFGVEAGPDRARRVGALEEAHGGTLYLDEVADMPLGDPGQNPARAGRPEFPARRRLGARPRRRAHHFLDQPRPRAGDHRRAVSRGSVSSPLGGADPRALARRAARGHSRADRISSWSRSPPRWASPPRRIAADAMAVLQSHDWPGNIRQLRNNIERLMILAAGDPEAEITAAMLPAEIGALVPAIPTGVGGEKLMSLPLREAREVFEREYLVAQINRFGGNISRTAEFIGMERSALHRKLKSLGVD